MTKIIIFGTGSCGKRAYEMLKNQFEIKYFCDNDVNKHGKSLFNIKIISPNQLLENKFRIIIASMYYDDISKQLIQLGIYNFIRFNDFILSDYFEEKLINDFYFENKSNYKSVAGVNIKKVLFVQPTHDIRTIKIAQMLNDNGVDVEGAYSTTSPEDIYQKEEIPYSRIIPINNINEFMNLINNTDYDIIHSSNEPDYLTNLLLQSNKPVIYDCHDIMGLRGDLNNDQVIQEYIAHKFSNGNIYVHGLTKKIAIDRFSLINKKMLVLNNYPSKLQILKKDKNIKKISELDGQIHLVYEGGLSNEKNNHRYLEEKFLTIAKHGINIHFYNSDNIEYCKYLDGLSKYLHFEGKCSSSEVSKKMQVYDAGLVLLNITERNRIFLGSTFPNKVFDYLLAGIPIIIEDIKILESFIEKYKCGIKIKEDNFKVLNLELIKKIKIEEDFILKNNFTMEDNYFNILNFYKDVKKDFVNNGREALLIKNK